MLITEHILATLVAPVGPRANAASLVAWLKLARGADLIVSASELSFDDAAGRSLGTQRAAFGLNEGTRLDGAISRALADDRVRPAFAVTARWRLNEWGVEIELRPPESEAARWLRVVYLPLQVPLATDVHLLVSVVNAGAEPIDVAEGMREARCWVDGVSYASTSGRLWDGEHRLRPGRARSLQFKLSDFPGAPRHGAHEMSMEILGARSEPEHVHWIGEPWPGTTA